MHAKKAKSNRLEVQNPKVMLAWGFALAAVAMLILAGVRMDAMTWGAVGIMSALGLATSLFSFRLDERTVVTFGPAVFMAAVGLFGALVAVWVAAFSGIVLELLRFRRGVAPAFGRVGIQVIGVIAAAAAYWAVGGVVSPSKLLLMDVIKFGGMFAVYSGVTGVLEALLQDPGSGRFRRYFRWLSGRGVVVELAMLPLSLLMVAAYIPNEPSAFPLLAVVLIISSAAGQKLWDTQQSLLNRVSELKTLNSVGNALTCAVRLDDLVRLVHRHTMSQLSAQAVSVALFDADQKTLEFKICIEDDCEIASRTTACGSSCTDWVGAHREVLYVHDMRKDEERTLAPPVAECTESKGVEVRSWLGVPLIAENKLVGVLSIMSDRARAFDEPTLELLKTIGTQVGKVVNTTRLYEELEVARRGAESWSKELEQKVKERTAELDDARGELESLNQDLEQRVEKRTQELRDMQTKIVQSGRLAAVGELAAGVAHELNNPLAGILGYAQYDLEKLKGAESVSESDLERVVSHLTFIESGAQRCAEIVASLLRFAETSSCASTDVDVNELIEETLGFTSSEFVSRGIELNVDLADGGLKVLGDPRQLQQVFANIVLNARKAMHSGGRLSVMSTRVPNENGGDAQVAISFGDTGCGIAKEDLVRVFEPFFTTGEVGEGSGLGLSVSYGIVEDHGGSIDIESDVGVGSTFTVLLPLAASGGRESLLEGRA